MVKKGLGQEKEHKILCLEKSLTISKQECAQWQERARPLHNFSWSSSLTIKLCNTAGIKKEGNMSKSFVMNIL